MPCVEQRVHSVISAKVQHIQHGASVLQDVVICTAGECQSVNLSEVIQLVKSIITTKIQVGNPSHRHCKNVIVCTAIKRRTAGSCFHA